MTGGVERVFLNIVSNITDKKVLILPIHQNYDDNLIKELPENVSIIKNDKYSLKGFLSVFNLIRLANYINREFVNNFEEFCVINFSDTISTIIVSCFIRAKRYLSWCHCNPNAYLSSKFFFLYKIFFKKFENIICICDTQKKEFCKVFGDSYSDKIIICFNLTDLKKIDNLKNEILNFNKEYILMVARFDNRSKDFYTLIDAYKRLDAALKEKYSLVFVGVGEDFEKIKQYAVLSGEYNHIVFTGLQKNPYKWMKNAKLFVLSSKTEGFPLVICEALATECPVISSDCISGPRDILMDGKYGLLFKVGDSDSLSKKMTLLLSDEKIYNNYVSTARKRIEEINSYAIASINKIFLK
mgnify:FL=1